MPLTQDDIRQHYETEWKRKGEAAADAAGLAYSDPVQDAVVYPIYEQLIRDLRLPLDGGSILDVGAGSGRWIRYFLERFKPELLLGVDYTHAAVELLKRWHSPHAQTRLEFRVADITDPAIDLGRQFDLINIFAVLYHIPESQLFTNALRNLAKHVKPDGCIITTEYLPRASMRTEWMMVRSRYEFEAAARAAGLQIAAIRGCHVFSDTPMGLDGSDAGVRAHFAKVRAGMTTILRSGLDDNSRQFFMNFLADIDRAVLAFCRERLADVELPAQKLVVLRRATAACSR